MYISHMDKQGRIYTLLFVVEQQNVHFNIMIIIQIKKKKEEDDDGPVSFDESSQFPAHGKSRRCVVDSFLKTSHLSSKLLLQL